MKKQESEIKIPAGAMFLRPITTYKLAIDPRPISGSALGVRLKGSVPAIRCAPRLGVSATSRPLSCRQCCGDTELGPNTSAKKPLLHSMMVHCSPPRGSWPGCSGEDALMGSFEGGGSPAQERKSSAHELLFVVTFLGVGGGGVPRAQDGHGLLLVHPEAAGEGAPQGRGRWGSGSLWGTHTSRRRCCRSRYWRWQRVGQMCVWRRAKLTWRSSTAAGGTSRWQLLLTNSSSPGRAYICPLVVTARGMVKAPHLATDPCHPLALCPPRMAPPSQSIDLTPGRAKKAECNAEAPVRHMA